MRYRQNTEGGILYSLPVMRSYYLYYIFSSRGQFKVPDERIRVSLREREEKAMLS